MAEYGLTRQVDHDFDRCIELIKEELEKQGFGVLSEIDVSEKFKEKLDVEFEKYLILGACNPEMAYKALQKEQRLGLLLPCNFIVYREDGKTFVSAIKPTEALEIPDNPGLEPVAEEVEADLEEVIQSI